MLVIMQPCYLALIISVLHAKQLAVPLSSDLVVHMSTKNIDWRSCFWSTVN